MARLIEILILGMLLTGALTCGLFIISIGTQAYGLQVRSLLYQSDVIIQLLTNEALDMM